MSSLVNSSGAPIQSGKSQPVKVPTKQQLVDGLGALLAQLMLSFRQNGIPGLYIIHAGNVMSQLTFDKDPKNRQTPAEIELMIEKEAEAMPEEVKVQVLRDSVTSDAVN
jgi:hypothetical protein